MAPPCRARPSSDTEGDISRILFMQQSILTGCRHTVPCDLPAASNGPFSISCLLGLAPGGVYHAAGITADAVSSYLAISPLPLAGRYLFCCTFHRLAAPGRYPAPCPAVFGLSSPPALRRASAAAWSPPFFNLPTGRLRGKYNSAFSRSPDGDTLILLRG